MNKQAINPTTIPYKSQLFMNLEKAEVDRIFKELQWSSKSYRKNEVIFRGDEYIEDLGIILEGKVIICKETGAGNKTMIALLDKGNFIGEVMAVSRNRITNTVIAGENGTEILFIPIPEILNYKSLTDNLILILAKKAFYLNRRVYYLQLKSIRAKISLFLLEEAEKNNSMTFSLSFNRQKMAEFLNVSRPSLSRELSRLKAEGVIDFYKESVKIIEKEVLESYQE